MQFESGQCVHFVGIGGFGISAIARILLERGFTVSGSDRNSNDLTEALARDGATVYHGHAEDYVNGADMLIVSSAIPTDHIEIVAAQEKQIPVYKRRDVLAALMEGSRVVAVAGTHGKTTTTSMIVHILREMGHDPSYIVGGVMASTGINAGIGQDDLFIIEADEYDNMFLGLKPDIAVITSMEFDHPDFFKSWIEMRESFRQFVNLLPRNGIVIGCGDDAATDLLLDDVARERAEEMHYRTKISYGVDLADFVDVAGWNYHVDEASYSVFDIELNFPLVGPIAEVRLSVSGRHNMLNALAAIIAVNQMMEGEANLPSIVGALESFHTTGRRFEIRGEVGGVTVIDDYAHHPTAIHFTLDAAKLRYPEAEIWAVWQPHMYSRTQKLLDDYLSAFRLADHVIVTEIYAAREEPIPGVDGKILAKAIAHDDVRFVAQFDEIAALLTSDVKSPAVIIIMSAGDAPQIGEQYLQKVGG